MASRDGLTLAPGGPHSQHIVCIFFNLRFCRTAYQPGDPAAMALAFRTQQQYQRTRKTLEWIPPLILSSMKSHASYHRRSEHRRHSLEFFGDFRYGNRVHTEHLFAEFAYLFDHDLLHRPLLRIGDPAHFGGKEEVLIVMLSGAF